MSEYIKTNEFMKVILITGFILLIMALLVILETPLPTGYEISIYSAYPIYFWILIIASIFLGQIVLLRYALYFTAVGYGLREFCWF